jgi:hypothetical protein
MTMKRWVMKCKDGYVKDCDDLIQRTQSLSEARLYNLSVVPKPNESYRFIPVQVTIEEESTSEEVS